MKEKKKDSFTTAVAKLLKNAFAELSKNDPLRMAGATAFFTTFALPPILVILIQGLGFFVTTDKAQHQLFNRLSSYIGKEAVAQVEITLNSIHRLARNDYIFVFGLIFLLFVATTLFTIIKSSLNQVWKIKVVHRSKVGATFTSRLKAALVILVAGILFMFGVFTHGVQLFLVRHLFGSAHVPFIYFNAALNHILSIVIFTAWFTVVFRYLPDARAPWSVVLSGALLTSILFAIGKLVLRWLLSYNNISSLYGASASIVLVMLFVFYSSLILYFGAAFTKVWSVYKGQPIEPLHYASHYKLITDEEDDLGNEV